MGLLLLAGLDVLYLTVFDAPWAVGAGDEAPPFEKAMAASALVMSLVADVLRTHGTSVDAMSSTVVRGQRCSWL